MKEKKLNRKEYSKKYYLLNRDHIRAQQRLYSLGLPATEKNIDDIIRWTNEKKLAVGE